MAKMGRPKMHFDRVQFSIRISRYMWLKLKKVARRKKRSLNDVIVAYLATGLLMDGIKPAVKPGDEEE